MNVSAAELAWGTGGYVLDGTKRWLGNGSIADVAVVWARLEHGSVGGFLVEGQGVRVDRQHMEVAGWKGS